MSLEKEARRVFFQIANDNGEKFTVSPGWIFYNFSVGFFEDCKYQIQTAIKEYGIENFDAFIDPKSKSKILDESSIMFLPMKKYIEMIEARGTK